MTCKDCIHREACKNIAYEYAGKDAASAYDDDSCCKTFVEICVNFSDKSEWVHFPDKNCKTAYVLIGRGDKAQIIEKPIDGWGIKDGNLCIIDKYGYLDYLGVDMVFLTKEEAQKELEQRRKLK